MTTAEIEMAIENIAEKTEGGAVSASEISERALSLKDKPMTLQIEADKIRFRLKEKLDVALEKSKGVEKIKL